MGNVVNLVSRAGGSLLKRLDHRLGALPPSGRELLTSMRAARGEIGDAYERCDFAGAIRRIMALADDANRLVNQEEPWNTIKTDEEAARGTVTTALHAARILATYLTPVVPALTVKIGSFLGVELSWAGVDEEFENVTLGKFERLLNRVERAHVDAMIEATKKEAEMAEAAASETAGGDGAKRPLDMEPLAPECTYDQFIAVDLRVARILEAEEVEGADKLLRVRLDLGGETRQVFAGIRGYYEPDELVGRLTVCVANLKPRKLGRFGVSEGMILAAGAGGEGVFLLQPDSGAQPGQRVT